MTRDDRIRVEPVGRCLLASLGTPSAPVSALAEALPEDDGERVAVVMSHAPAERMAELAARLQPWAPIEWESIRLVAAYAGGSLLRLLPRS